MVNIKKIKQAVSIILTGTLFITTILPISNVYAADIPSLGTVEGESNGSSERLGPTYNTEFNVGELGADSVRAYIYDIKADEFIQGEYEGNTFDAIDFLGSQSVGLHNEIPEEYYDQDVSKETAFKTAENILTEDSYPFEKAYVDVRNNIYISNTYEITEGLKENNGEKLKAIVETYWGSNVYNTLRRNGNLIFVVEPLMITSVLDDNGYLVDDHAAAVKTTVTKHKKTFYEIPKGLENGDVCQKGTEVKETNSNGDNVTATTEYYTVSDNDEDLLQLIREKYGSADYIYELRNPYTEDGRPKQNYLVVDHFDVKDESWEEETTEYLSQHYRYKLGTARYFMEYYDMEVKEYESGEYSTSQLEVPSYYNVPNWMGKAVFTEHIGENGRYDSHYNLAFPTEVKETKADETDVQVNKDGKTKKLTAYWNGDSTALEMDGKITTFGMAVLAPGCDAGIWHTNKYTTGEPSGVPADDVTQHPQITHTQTTTS